MTYYAKIEVMICQQVSDKVYEGYIFTRVCLSTERAPDPGGEGGCLLQGDACSGGSAPRGGCLLQQGLLLGGGLLLGVCGDPPMMATAAGGTHPTGMHSCLT